jgi:hypothetical protein
MHPHPHKVPCNRRAPLGLMIGQLAGDLVRLAGSVPRGGIVVAQEIWSGLVWGGKGGSHYPRHCCAPGCHQACHHFSVECYPMLPHGGCGPCGHH